MSSEAVDRPKTVDLETNSGSRVQASSQASKLQESDALSLEGCHTWATRVARDMADTRLGWVQMILQAAPAP